VLLESIAERLSAILLRVRRLSSTDLCDKTGMKRMEPCAWAVALIMRKALARM
jgi:hypothetical protein